ncbi:ATP-binding protein [Candidatus Foliamicus sp.]
MELEPRASALAESLRDMGYSLRTALADVIDNSITAGARKVELLADTHDEFPAIGVLDDGFGMTRQELLNAMRPGSRSPLEQRHADDLGRFGLGLKTASFSQCRRLTVRTRKDGVTSCATWDLDKVAARDKWVVEIPSDHDISRTRWATRLSSDGTLVIWEKLDRLVDADAKTHRQDLVRQLDETATHLEFVFHRFLAGQGGNRVAMSLNGHQLRAFDPFNANHLATQHHPEEIFSLNGKTIRIWPVTLPHHAKVSKEDWERLAGPEGYVRNQGFYLYRNRRMILHGTWFGLARQLELTKLARVGIDLPNTLDAEWKIDVRKASAQPPAVVRARLSRIIEKMGIPSRRTYTGKGTKLAAKSRLPAWTRIQDKGRISYEINGEHPLITALHDALSEERANEFERILRFLAAALPVEALHVDVSASPHAVGSPAIRNEDLETIISTMWKILQAQKLSSREIKERMRSAAPFRTDWDRTLTIIERLAEEKTDPA